MIGASADSRSTRTRFLCGHLGLRTGANQRILIVWYREPSTKPTDSRGPAFRPTRTTSRRRIDFKVSDIPIKLTRWLGRPFAQALAQPVTFPRQ